MYSNIGKKIKSLTKALSIVLMVLSFIAGLVLCVIDEELIATGIVTMILTPLVIWASSFLVYGFGELVDKTSEIADKLGSATPKKHDPAKKDNLHNLLEKGMLTEEEYNALLNEENKND